VLEEVAGRGPAPVGGVERTAASRAKDPAVPGAAP
jgi:hypothetical protein